MYRDSGTFFPRKFSVKKDGTRYIFPWFGRKTLDLGLQFKYQLLPGGNVTHNLLFSLGLL